MQHQGKHFRADGHCSKGKEGRWHLQEGLVKKNQREKGERGGGRGRGKLAFVEDVYVPGTNDYLFCSLPINPNVSVLLLSLLTDTETKV
jgi:hypothetical protein